MKDGFGVETPQIGVCALNPHAGEEDLFGDEETRIIAPAVGLARADGIAAAGPMPADTLMVRARDGEFDAVVAMYHDQGHIALKLLGMHRAVNITLGLPIVRTSVAHGTAFDRAWQGTAEASGMVAALARRRGARAAKLPLPRRGAVECASRAGPRTAWQPLARAGRVGSYRREAPLSAAPCRCGSRGAGAGRSRSTTRPVTSCQSTSVGGNSNSRVGHRRRAAHVEELVPRQRIACRRRTARRPAPRRPPRRYSMT